MRTISKSKLNQIIHLVCDYTGCDPATVKSKCRKTEIVVSRQITMFLLKEGTEMSNGDIGENMGGKDHATVIHSRKVISNAIDLDQNPITLKKGFARDMAGLRGKVRAIIHCEEIIEPMLSETTITQVINDKDITYIVRYFKSKLRACRKENEVLKKTITRYQHPYVHESIYS